MEFELVTDSYRGTAINTSQKGRCDQSPALRLNDTKAATQTVIW